MNEKFSDIPDCLTASRHCIAKEQISESYVYIIYHYHSGQVIKGGGDKTVPIGRNE